MKEIKELMKLKYVLIWILIKIWTASDINDIDIKSQLEHRIQNPETKESGWIIDKLNSMKKKFQKTGEINRSRYVKIPLRSNAILNIEKIDK